MRDQNCVHVLPPKTERGGFIYFVRCLSPERQIKIGFTNDLGPRLSSLKIGCPYPLILAAFYWHEEPSKEERRLFERYGAQRIRGEWFASSPALEADVEVIGRLRRTAIERVLAGIRPDVLVPVEPKPSPGHFVWRGRVRPL